MGGKLVDNGETACSVLGSNLVKGTSTRNSSITLLDNSPFTSKLSVVVVGAD